MSYFTASGHRAWLKSSADFVGSRMDAIAFGLIGLLALMRLPEPLFGDQALFLVGGKAIQSGALLYRDFWDVKPPGIYGVFTLAGTLFGFNEIGLHWFDCLWMLGLACTLRLTLAHHFSQRWIAQILPWIAVGGYFSILGPAQQMQVESLIGLPLYLVIWFNLKASQQPAHRTRWLILSGVMGGIVLLFKLIYLPILVGFWLIDLLHVIVRQHQQPLPALFQTVWPLLLGILLPIGPVMLYLISAGTLNEAMYTMFQHPPKMVRELPKQPLKLLAQVIFWVFRKFLPLIILSGFAIRYSIRRMDLLTVQMTAWLGLGSVMILAQTQSWWNYHWMLLLVPLSVLGAIGIDRLGQSTLRQRRTIIAASLAYLIGLNLLALGWTGSLMVRSGFDLTPAGQRRYQVLSSPWYKTAIEEVAFLKQADSRPGDIYVIGESIFYVLSERGQALPLPGCVPQIFLQSQWAELVDQLNAAKPPYVFVASDYTDPIPKHFMPVLTSMYRPLRQSAAGTWYEIKAA
jgi:hypothetical protein